MRILHTADWHVGRTLRGRSRADEHRAVLAEIAEIAASRSADIVIVAGDLFDVSAPTAESEEIVYRGLLGLAGTGADVVVIAGNHDHPRRLGAVRPLLDMARVHVRSELARPDAGGVLDITRDGVTARLALLPFLSQRGIVTADALMTKDAAAHVQSYAERFQRIATSLCDSFDDACVNIVVAHATVIGAKLGGGEREAHTVFEYSVPSQVFPATAHYIALGHIHRAQEVRAASPARYCGSPLQLDFGETANRPEVLIVEAQPGVPVRVEAIPLSAGRRLRTLRGTVDSVAAQANDAGDDYLRVVLTEPSRAGLADDVRTRFENAVDVIVAPAEDTKHPKTEWSPDHTRRSPAELFGEYLREKSVVDPALVKLFAHFLEEAVAPDTTRD
jgi:DNA repair protein SbcD/Mre11